MCTVLISFQPTDTWPIRAAFVRDEDRDRQTDPPGQWWDEQPAAFGGHDVRAGGTWLAVDVTQPMLAMLTDQFDPDMLDELPDPATSPTRGTLPLLALRRGVDLDLRADAPGAVETYQPFHLITAQRDASGAWRVQRASWDGRSFEQLELEPGLHVVASRARSIPGEAERRTQLLTLLEPVAADSPTPHLTGDTRESWGRWVDLLDGRSVEPGQTDALSIHSVSIRPGFGTVGGSLVALSAAGDVRYDYNATATLDPAAWQPVNF